jgi:O-Antigen ligase
MRGALSAAAIVVGVFLFALIFAVASRDQPLVALAIPGVLLTGVLCARWPAVAVAAVLALSATFGSLQAFLGFSAGPAIDVLLAGLWVSVLLSYAVGTRERPWWIWPGVAVLVLYITVTFFEIFTALGASLGALSFKYSAWYMMCVPLLAFAGWQLNTYLRISRALIAVAVLVGAYAVVRLFIGPAAGEERLAYEGAGAFNVVGDELSLVGSFPNRHELAFWAATTIPFCLAAVLLGGRAFWKLAAAVAIGLCFAAVFGTDVRAALPAIVAGCGTVIVLNMIAGRFQGTALAQGATALVLAISAGAGLFVVVVGEESPRYGAILSPSGDPSYEQHLNKWRATLDELEGHPFGLGLATAGRVQQERSTPYITAGTYAIDNSYLKIAFEQGFPVLALFAAAMIAILIGLARRAVRVRAGPVRGLAIGAAGTMVTGLAMFVTGGYIESLGVLFLWISIGAAVGALAAAKEAEPGVPA